MVGVAANPEHLPWVAEFFELFKTPWEPVVSGRQYDVVLIADGHSEPKDAKLVLIYGTKPHPVDRRFGVTLREASGLFRTQNAVIPVSGGITRFDHTSSGVTSITDHVYAAHIGETKVLRFGCDLFREVARLLTNGQPVEQAEVPTLELQIAVIRHCLQTESVSYIEVPPRPYGHAFVCCLTHDIDFFGIRRHFADRTLAGFVMRATAGSTVDVLRGRRTTAQLRRNLAAVCSLPLVFVGMKRDFWQPFEDYARADRGHARTYFLVPFKGRPGVSPDQQVEPLRAVAYGADDIASEVRAAADDRTEFAVHGIEAWRDADAGKRELDTVAAVAGAQQRGVRMHWLYYDEQTPSRLESAGFKYDSTWGYNEAVGYRAGTMQPFKLRGTMDLLELPLAVMDTAMLYPGRMALLSDEANARSSKVVQDGRNYGGAVVVNWHDRSLAPERQWGRCYNYLLDELEAASPWFATLGDAAAWFRWRRCMRFERVASNGNEVTIVAPPVPAGLPPARITTRQADSTSEVMFSGRAEGVRL